VWHINEELTNVTKQQLSMMPVIETSTRLSEDKKWVIHKKTITDIKDYNEAILRYEWLDLERCSTADGIGGFISAFLAKRSKETGELH
jgi:hypothetical protein